MNQTSQNIISTSSKEKTIKKVWDILNTVNDPEIPVLSVIDLGIVRDIKIDNEIVEVIITPTYSGCPAMDMIGMNIRKAFLKKGFEKIKISYQLSPAWTTDWMSEQGNAKLKSYGIAPPTSKTFHTDYLKNLPIECPHCHSMNTKLISQFGSTACKALYQCEDCGEPFDYFKCH
ncbi:MAG TPA: 1,2-phenylacetyl-CoA epoxidase subunit PaaD [Hanamia sp.]|nr:1,2-phenylacetyl-CoA epoxidase subunit PaaD [Hanamia sp.]